MTPQSVPGLRITASDIRPIWMAIANPHSGALRPAAASRDAEAAERVPVDSLAA
jgi:hypothetical protein